MTWDNLRVEFYYLSEGGEAKFFFIVNNIYRGETSVAFGSICHIIIPVGDMLSEGAVGGGVVSVLFWVEVTRHLREGRAGLNRFAPAK